MDVIENRAIKALSFDRNWVGWRYEQRNGSKPTKPPINPRGGYAKCDDPSTWGSLEEALTAKEKMNLDGIGFMLTPSASVTAIDIDNCIVGGELSPLAREVIASVNSYSEISPSGAGVRILAIGSLPDGGRKNTELGIEVYDQSRYVTVTGNHLPGTPADIEDRSEQLKQFHQKYFNKPTPANNGSKPTPVVNLDDQSIIDKAMKAGNGAKFQSLWSGDTSGYPSSSEADQALTNILAFWTKDQSQIDRLFRQSGLNRQKWDEKHNAGGATYGQMTIEKALAGVTDTYTPGHKDKTTPQVETPKTEEVKKPRTIFLHFFPI